MFAYFRQEGDKTHEHAGGELFASPDGIHWNTIGPVGYSIGDNSSIFYDAFRRQWVFSIRNNATALAIPRARYGPASAAPGPSSPSWPSWRGPRGPSARRCG